MSTATETKASLRKDITWDQYRELPRMNGSTLVAGRDSMLELKRAIDGGGRVETKPMRFGSQLHCLLLEPDRFEETHVVMPDFKVDPGNLTKSGTRSFAKTQWVTDAEDAFRAENEGKEVIGRSDYDKALCMIESVRSHPLASDWLRTGAKEITALGEIRGIAFKGRIDILTDGRIIDLKSTGDVSPRRFKWTNIDFGYPEKLAIYRELVRQVTGDVLPVNAIAVEGTEPWDRVNYDYPYWLLDYAMHRVNALIDSYKMCRESGIWPGKDHGAESVEVPVPESYMPSEEMVPYVRD